MGGKATKLNAAQSQKILEAASPPHSPIAIHSALFCGMGGKATKLNAAQSQKMFSLASPPDSPIAQSWSFISDFPSQAERSVAYTSLEEDFHFVP
jgi:hypothetical protein